MKKVDIYCFSGTGNTYLLVKKMRETFVSLDVACKVRHITKNLSGDVDTTHTIGLAFPIACFSTYPFVWDFIDSLPETSTKTTVFLLATFAEQDGGISAQIAEALERKGYVMLGYSGVKMPSNFLNKKVDAQKDMKRISAGQEKVAKFVRDLVDGNTEFTNASKLYAAIGKATYYVSFKTGLSSKLLKIKINSSKCTGCGICAGLCPVDNIKMVEGKAVMGSECQSCMRCMGFCPAGAMSLFKAIPYAACSYMEFEEELNG